MLDCCGHLDLFFPLISFIFLLPSSRTRGLECPLGFAREGEAKEGVQ